MEHGGQAFHQATEIHPALGGKEEEDLRALKGALHPHQLHLQLVLQDLLLADPEGVFLLLPVALHDDHVRLVGQAQHRAQGVDQGFRGVLKVPPDTGGVFHPGGGLHNDAVPSPVGGSLGVKIVLLPFTAEANADDFHRISLLTRRRTPQS